MLIYSELTKRLNSIPGRRDELRLELLQLVLVSRAEDEPAVRPEEVVGDRAADGGRGACDENHLGSARR